MREGHAPSPRRRASLQVMRHEERSACSRAVVMVLVSMCRQKVLSHEFYQLFQELFSCWHARMLGTGADQALNLHLISASSSASVSGCSSGSSHSPSALSLTSSAARSPCKPATLSTLHQLMTAWKAASRVALCNARIIIPKYTANGVHAARASRSKLPVLPLSHH